MAEETLEKTEIADSGFDGFDVPFEEKIVTPIEEKAKTEEKKPENKEGIKPDEKKPETSIEDGRNFLKEKLGYEDWDSAKTELETLKSKALTPSEIKYANEMSEKVHKAVLAGNYDPLYEYFDSQKKYSKLTEGEVTLSNAASIIKGAMAAETGLTPEQIDYRFNKQFATPKKPVQGDEMEDEYLERVAEWEQKVKDNEMDLLIEAKLKRPALEKLKSELKFPEIPISEPKAEELTPEEQAENKKQYDSFIKNAEDAISEFEGLSVAYKDKDVDISSNYTLSDEEKSAVKEQVMLLAENNYNSNAVFAERWVKDDLTIDFKKMTKDLAILESYDKSSQKFVGDAVSKATLKLIKDKHKIDIGGSGSGDLQLEDKTTQQKNEDAIWN